MAGFNERQKELMEPLVEALKANHNAAAAWLWAEIVTEEMKKRSNRLSAWERLRLPKEL